MTLNQGDTVLITGATGQQGGAVVDALLADGRFGVRALTRDTGSDGAKAVAAKGAELVQGNMEDRGAVDAAMAGVRGVFSIQVQTGPDGAAEKRQGFGIVDAAKAAGVAHVVYNSSAATGRKGPGDTEDFKDSIEQHVRGSGITFTLLRPTSFMENLRRVREQVSGGTFLQALPPAVHQEYVSVGDIGRVAAAAFAQPERFGGQSIDLVGDRLTQTETAEVLGRVLGKPVAYQQLDPEQLPPFRRSFTNWLEQHDGYGVNPPSEVAERVGFPLLSLEEWLTNEGWGAA